MDIVKFGIMAIRNARYEGDKVTENQIWSDLRTEARDEFPDVESRIKEVIDK